MSDIGKRIKDLRLESGMTQLQLAQHCECSGQIISNIERGYTKPDVETINKIAKYLKVPSDYLLGITNSKWMAEIPYSTDTHMSERLSALMEKDAVSIEDFSDKAGIALDDVSKILSGELKPNTDALARIAKLFGTTVNFLIGASDISTAIASDEEEDIILYYRNMSKKKKRLFMGELEKIMDM